MQQNGFLIVVIKLFTSKRAIYCLLCAAIPVDEQAFLGCFRWGVHTVVETKWLTCDKRHFLEWKLSYLASVVPEMYYCGFIRRQLSTVSGNGLVQNRQQAIIWTNDVSVYWRIYTLLGFDERRVLSFFTRVVLISMKHPLRTSWSMTEKKLNLIYGLYLIDIQHGNLILAMSPVAPFTNMV